MDTAEDGDLSDGDGLLRVPAGARHESVREVLEMTSIPNEPTSCIVFGDAAGAYFLVPLSVVEAGRVPQAMVPDLVTAMGHDASGDTDGFAGRRNLGGFRPIGQIGVSIGTSAGDSDQQAAGQLKKQVGTSDLHVSGFTGFTQLGTPHWP